MDLIKWDSSLPLDDLFGEESLSQAVAGWDLATDVYEKDGAVVAEMQLPGVEPGKYDIKLEGGVLVVSGEREKSTEIADQDMFRREIQRGSFLRRVRLPEGEYDASGISAGLENGLLKVLVPKK